MEKYSTVTSLINCNPHQTLPLRIIQKKTLQTPGRKWKDSIKTKVMKSECEGADRTERIHHRVQYRADVKAVLNPIIL
jgi:hypothetical protein